MEARTLNGHQLRRRCIPPQPQNEPEAIIPRSLINITEPMKSESFMARFKARMEQREAREVIINVYLETFQWLASISFL